ncbi:MAG: ABC-2 family transporter protein [Oscillospiraceae bacterium]|jgi:ABC-2 type transport system permease protein|nr:ABC-2 family transporter protein [Oscillospiraceae bacterium]
MIANLKFIGLLIKLKLSHMMVFRLSFFGAFFSDAALFVMQLAAFQAIYGQVDAIGGWSRGQMLIFIGTFSMINGLSMLICFFGIVNIPDKIRGGDLDLYLTKPVNPLLRLTFENINLGSAPLLFLSGGIVAYGAAVEGAAVTMPLILAYSALTLLMALLYYDIDLIMRTLPFFFIGTNAINRMTDALVILNFRVPGVIYKGVFKVLFWFVLPYGIMATVPTQALTGTLTPLGLLYALGIVALFTAFALRFWRFGLTRYKSASS